MTRPATAPRRGPGRPVKLFSGRAPVLAETRTFAAYLRLDADDDEADARRLRVEADRRLRHARLKRELAETLEHPPAPPPAPTTPERDICGITETARRTGISDYRLRQLIQAGTLPALRDGDGTLIQPYRVRLADVAALFAGEAG